MSKEKFKEKLDLLNTASTVRFNTLIEYYELEVKRWSVSYVNFQWTS
jgi:hypothetical protein